MCWVCLVWSASIFSKVAWSFLPLCFNCSICWYSFSQFWYYFSNSCIIMSTSSQKIGKLLFARILFCWNFSLQVKLRHFLIRLEETSLCFVMSLSFSPKMLGISCSLNFSSIKWCCKITGSSSYETMNLPTSRAWSTQVMNLWTFSSIVISSLSNKILKKVLL